nr:VWA domain-containing protein [uncultured Lichenicoccus sp.]
MNQSSSYHPVASGVSHVASVGFSPLLPMPVLLGLGAVCVLVLAIGFALRAGGTIWRLLGFAVLFGWLAGPHLVRATWQALPETALLVLDRTGSMTVGRRTAIADAATARLREAANRLPGIALRTVVVPAAVPGSGGGTRLFSALARAESDIPAGQLAGVIALTDGQVHDVPSEPAATGARGKPPVPFHALIVASGEQADRRLRVLSAPPYAIIGHDATLRVQVEDLGPEPQPGAHATLSLRRDGEAPLTREVQVGVPQDITLPVTHPGPMLVQLTSSPLPGEVSTLNNQAVVQINGVRDRLRVLLVSGAPNQGERVWRRLLKADPAVDLVHFTILRPPDKDDTTPLNELALIAFPTRELFQEKIDSFDLIILDGFENRGILPLAYLQNIADFVRGGGGLLLTAGPEFIGRGSLQDTPLGDILPVHVSEEGGLLQQRFQPAPTALGRRHPVTADLPQMPPLPGSSAPGGAAGADPGWGPWFRALRADQSHGEVLLDSPDGAGGVSPLLVLDHVDRGRVAVLLSDQIWLWSRGEAGGGPQAELLRRIAHWLMKEPDLEEEQMLARVEQGHLLVTRRSIDEQAARTVQVMAPDGSRSGLRLKDGRAGMLRGRLEQATAPGIWEVTDGMRHAYAASQPDDPEEIADLRATATKLAPVAARSGGATAWLGDDPAHVQVPELRLVTAGATAHGSGWIGLARTGAHVVTGTRIDPLLPPWVVLAVLVALLFAAWRREGRT